MMTHLCGMVRTLATLLACALCFGLVAQTYKNEPKYDPLDTRHDLSRPLLERFWITCNHGWACFNKGLKEEGRMTTKEQLELAEQLGVDTLIAMSYDDLSSAFIGSADAALQLKYAYKGLEYANASGSPNSIGTAQKGLATVYKPLGDLPRALDLLKQAITNVRSQMQINRTCCHLSDCYRLMGQPDSALYWAQRSNIIGSPADDDYGYSRSYYMLGAAYAAKGERQLAEVHFARAIEVADSFHVMIPLYGSLLARGRMKLEVADVAGAIADGRRGLEVCRTGEDLNGMIESADLLRSAFRRSGQLDSAYHFFEMKSAYADSLKSATNLNKIQSMAFEQELKDREDAKLRADEATERSRNIQFGIIALIVITLGIFLLIFSRTSVVGAKAIK
ncbi:MAG: tetratricopeptide repeat protein, partial [Flavobacteriales bacterium]